MSESRHKHKHSKKELTEEQISKRSIYVCNIPSTMKARHLIAGFSVIGHITDIQFSSHDAYSDPVGGQECVITFANPMNAVQAVTCLNNHLTHGSQISVSLVQPQKLTEPTNQGTGKSSTLIIENVQKDVTVEHIKSLFSVFGFITSCISDQNGVMRISFSSKDAADRALHSMNHFSLKGNQLFISYKDDVKGPKHTVLNKSNSTSESHLRTKLQSSSNSISNILANNDTVEAVGFVDYSKPRQEKENEALSNSCIILVTGFSDADDLRDAQNISELKKIAIEQGKIKDMKYVEVNKEKRVFFRFANSYAASIAVTGFSGILFNNTRLEARLYDYKQYKLRNYTL